MVGSEHTRAYRPSPPKIGVLFKIALWKIILIEIHTTILVPLSFPNKIDFLLQPCFNITSVRTISKQIDRISLISNKKQSGWVWQRHLQFSLQTQSHKQLVAELNFLIFLDIKKYLSFKNLHNTANCPELLEQTFPSDSRLKHERH